MIFTIHHTRLPLTSLFGIPTLLSPPKLLPLKCTSFCNILAQFPPKNPHVWCMVHTLLELFTPTLPIHFTTPLVQGYNAYLATYCDCQPDLVLYKWRTRTFLGWTPRPQSVLSWLIALDHIYKLLSSRAVQNLC